MYGPPSGMHYDQYTTGTHDSFQFVPTANAIIGAPTLTHMDQDREVYTVAHKHHYMKQMKARGPYKTFNLADSILTINDPKPLQADVARDRLAGMGHIQIMKPHGELSTGVY